MDYLLKKDIIKICMILGSKCQRSCALDIEIAKWFASTKVLFFSLRITTLLVHVYIVYWWTTNGTKMIFIDCGVKRSKSSVLDIDIGKLSFICPFLPRIKIVNSAYSNSFSIIIIKTRGPRATSLT
jgi:hypothetical protein